VRRWLARLWARLTGQPVPSQGDRLGNRGETIAADFLERQGFRILERNHRNTCGEVDLIALDQESVVFVEVKTRTTRAAGDPTEAITAVKQRKLTRAALAYLKQHRWLERRCRFDVVAIVWDGSAAPEIRHFRSAFEAAGSGQMY